MADNINHPAHYKAGGMEAIDVIEAFGLGFHLGNATKYILRAGRKTADAREDIEKAIWYLERQLKTQNTKHETRNTKEAEMITAFGELYDLERMNFLAWYRGATVEEIAIARRNNAARLDALKEKYAKEIELMDIING